MVEAFLVEKRLPDKRVGPAMVRNTWKLDTTDTFAERVGQGELARENVWEAWARAGGALPHEVSRMEEALSWPGTVVSERPCHRRKVLLAWAFCVAYGKPLRRMTKATRLVAHHVLQGGGYRLDANCRLSNARAVAVR